ncbi:larval cuticle protein A2B-like [Neodiprion virginianus]|uniref:larval cuticle protein A2B-like n=1 Tax=Neodiprion virginianus TaxID=2961670 RepID=UPI001EE6A3DE|nr:larval cuticle protein A2B-like [Neodiprion virginianus]
MAVECFLFIGMIAAAHGAFLHHPIPAGAVLTVAKPVDSHDPNPQYNYAYNVQNALTGDSKMQHEIRDGDVVRGSYSLVEPDGSLRVVDYTADPVNGFNAVVRKKPAIVKVAVTAPVTLARPLTVAPHRLLFAYPGSAYAHRTLGLIHH